MRVPFNDSRTEVFYLGLTQDNRIHIGGGSPSYFFNDGVEIPAVLLLILLNSSVSGYESTPACWVLSSKQVGME